MFSKHGISSYIISNKDLEFMLNFFYSLGTTLDIWLYFTSGYYPKGDGQTECTNQTLKQYCYKLKFLKLNKWINLILG